MTNLGLTFVNHFKKIQNSQNLGKLVPQRFVFSNIGIFKVILKFIKVFHKGQVSSKWLLKRKMNN